MNSYKFKFQILNPKFQTNPKSQFPKFPTNKFWSWVICSLVIVCNLVLGHWNFSYLFAQEQVIYDSKGRRNPFIPLVTPDGRLLKLEPQTMEGLLLEGIVYDKEGSSYAVVNGKIVKVGDEINGYQVLRIKEGKVTLIKEGQTIDIELEKEEELP